MRIPGYLFHNIGLVHGTSLFLDCLTFDHHSDPLVIQVSAHFIRSTRNPGGSQGSENNPGKQKLFLFGIYHELRRALVLQSSFTMHLKKKNRIRTGLCDRPLRCKLRAGDTEGSRRVAGM